MRVALGTSHAGVVVADAPEALMMGSRQSKAKETSNMQMCHKRSPLPVVLSVILVRVEQWIWNFCCHAIMRWGLNWLVC